jgi:hypothetical protein
MSDSQNKYRFSNYALFLIVLVSAFISYYFKFSYKDYPLNFMGGDAKDYYSPLISLFINHDFTSQSGPDWFLLKTNTGTINVHPVGVALLLLPFFALAYFSASVFGFPVDGLSLPFQISVSAAALFYALMGFHFLKKLFRDQGISDKVSALILLLIFFGTNLLNYTLSEAGMSHVYSFSLISIFMYASYKLVTDPDRKHILFAAAILGLILLVRPNNIFAALIIFFWFRSLREVKLFFGGLVRQPYFYLGLVLTTAIMGIQSLVWYFQSNALLHNTYKADGFYWTKPQILKMLFGFDGGFFIYAPLCLLFMAGLLVIFKKNKFSSVVMLLFFTILFYFFSSYWAFTYFDGLGIRVLVDYYGVFALMGAKLFENFDQRQPVFATLVLAASFFTYVNLVYCYQANRGILLRAGMTFRKWQHVFLRTSPEYRDVLGGSNELVPYAAAHPSPQLTKEETPSPPFDYSGKEYGLLLQFDSLGFNSNRIHFKIDCARKENEVNSSKDALVCVNVKDRQNGNRAYLQFRLNEAPAKDCCEKIEYHYTTNVVGKFKSDDKLSVFIWNINKQAFEIDRFAVRVYNYNYLIN